MNHAINAAREGEDFDYYAEEELELTQGDFEKITTCRLKVLDYIADQHVRSINELAKLLNRDVKNVYLDLKFLELLGFIRFIKEGRGHIPELLIQELTLQLG